MGPLVDLQVTLDGSDGKHTRERGLCAWHIESCFLHYLPNRYVLDGKRKTVIDLCTHGRKTFGRPIREIEGMPYATVDSVALVSVTPFDLGTYLQKSPDQRDEIVVDIVETTLGAIAKEFGADPKPVRDAAHMTRENRFSWEAEGPLSRSTKDRRLRFHVFKRVARNGVSYWIEVRDHKQPIDRIDVLTNGSFYDVNNFLTRSRIEAGAFILTDEIDRDQFSLPLSKYAS